MMAKQLILSVGKKNDPDLAKKIDEFAKRISRAHSLEWQFIAPSGFSGDHARKQESAHILEKLRSDDYAILLDERGKNYSSTDFSKVYESAIESSRIVFVIGGAYGVDETLRARANIVWSLSNLVFPHQIVRLILVEQVYRAQMISQNHPYHHE